MGASLQIGNTLVPAEEVKLRTLTGEFSRFLAEAGTNPDATILFSTGGLSGSAVADRLPAVAAAPAPAPPSGPAAPGAGAVPAFEPIGVGKPLGIEILTLYTGDAPGRGIFGVFGSKPDLLVTSAVKAVQTFDAAPRAINQIIRQIGDYEYHEPGALAEGTPIVYYSPAVVDSTILCTVELVVDSFDEQTVQRLSALLATAAGVPVFAPASMYLMAGSVITKVFANLGKALLEGDPFLHADLSLHFDTPGIPVALAQNVLFYNDRDASEFKDYVIQLLETGPQRQRVTLVHREKGTAYAGRAPFVIASLDGREKATLQNFAPRLASAAVLDRFYRAQDQASPVADAIDTAMQLYNDLQFRRKADAVQAQLATLARDSEAYKQAQTLLAAYTGNIRNKEFQLPKPAPAGG